MKRKLVAKTKMFSNALWFALKTKQLLENDNTHHVLRDFFFPPKGWVQSEFNQAFVSLGSAWMHPRLPPAVCHLSPRNTPRCQCRVQGVWKAKWKWPCQSHAWNSRPNSCVGFWSPACEAQVMGLHKRRWRRLEESTGKALLTVRSLWILNSLAPSSPLKLWMTH